MSIKHVIAGIDEAGRGALAGPVVAAACHLSDKKITSVKITDSKMMTEKEREESFKYLVNNFPYGVGIVDAGFIDSDGILAATEKAMQIAVEELSKIVRPTYLLVDGRDKFWFDIPHSSVIKGDQKEKCIAAASIIAKVTRDHIMKDEDIVEPGYLFAEHKGYGTEAHFDAISKKGISNLHRRTFLRNLESESPVGAFSK
ncbi:ribonuclease HII [Candidatus Peribacteria bacterium]|jgi:ribonuclease HII|nr:ribonuclease HII [Candidatus Peribacteria bacterium]MBT4021294.1 ribonuclease HII [Candidatus Peribacteria bacterium]MBT4241245.1 ribonuclease HII [Candidatus Peribacteria bacterium]MBT4474270.1 ribonuclease HII [Candidatus Peribacteria bacterium]